MKILSTFILVSTLVAGSAMAQSGVVIVPETTLLLFAEVDCNGDRRGAATKNSCGCVGGNTGVDSSVTCVTTGTGKVWMDRNLGASQVATSLTDTLAYGDLYQWGRLTDGHQIRTSLTVTEPSDSDVPGHGDFIVNTSTPWDWRIPQYDNLWQGVSGTNNPCPSGFRIPTSAEWELERLSWSSDNATGAYESPLKLLRTGYRNNDGVLRNVGTSGYYWSSTVDEIYSDTLELSSGGTDIFRDQRVYGFNVRCIKD